MENNSIFRKKNMDRLSSPEELNDYLRVTNPSTWLILGAVIMLLAGLLIWSNFAVIQSYANGTAKAEGGVLTISFEDERTAANIETGMTVTVGNEQTTVKSVGRDAAGRTIAAASADVPDGTYDVKVGYRQTKIIQLLFN